MAATPEEDQPDRNLVRIRGLQGRIDLLQAQLDELPFQIAGRMLAAGLLGLLAATWLYPEPTSDGVGLQRVAAGFHSGFGVFAAPWPEEYTWMAVTARVALVVYVLVALFLIALSPRLRSHTVLAFVGIAATAVVLLMKPQPPLRDIDDPSIVYHWSPAPFFAIAVWLALVVVGFAMRSRST